MNDWIGIGILLLLACGVVVGLRILSKPRKSTEADFERRAEEGASFKSSGIDSLNGMVNPGAAKGTETVREIKKGTFDKKQSEGKSIGNAKESVKDVGE